jgi:hypothetical protein
VLEATQEVCVRAMNHKRCSPGPIRICLVVAVALTLAAPASAEWKEKVLYSFQGGADGSLPGGGVIFDKAGNLYGVTVEGGSTACPPGWCGTVYQLSPPVQKGGNWTETILYVFKGHNQNDGSSPSGGLIADSAGNFYGITGYGGSGPCVLFGTATGCGTVFQLSPPAQKGGAWTETVLYNFQGGKDGDLPTGPLVFDKTGNLYGATEFGGGKGTTCNAFYGGNCGTVFKLSPPKTQGGKWTERVLHAFSGVPQGKQVGDGAEPNGGLVLDSKSMVYGTTAIGGNQVCQNGQGQPIGCGTVFRLHPPAKAGHAWIEGILHRFTDGKDGAGPNGGMIFDAKSRLYGTSGGGGNEEVGVVFRVALAQGRWAETVLYSFQGNNDGRNPWGPVTFDSAGSLYGTAHAGSGQEFGGVIFALGHRVNDKWRYGVLHNFSGAPDGAYPVAKLIFDDAGNVYSTTQGGGTGNGCQGGCGTVFEALP